MMRHKMFDQMVDFCKEWWSENEGWTRAAKKPRVETEEEEEEPTFLEFTQMMGV